jgi:hypothetical protein
MGRNELYHLGNDIGEQNDLMAKEKKQGSANAKEIGRLAKANKR